MSDETTTTPPTPSAPADPNLSTSQASLSPEDELSSLERIMDIPLVVTVELGRTRMLIGDLIQLGAGSVLELSKLADEPLDVYVHGKLVARGEAVVVNDRFGVRLNDIVSPTERLQSLTS